MELAQDAVERAERVAAGEEPSGVDDLVALVGGLKGRERFDLVADVLIAVARRALYQDWQRDRRPDLAKLLEDNRQFGYARRLWKGLSEAMPGEVHFRRRYAFCTYKDMELPTARRLDRALRILTARQALEHCDSSETLGLAGAIYKRKWDAEGRLADLESARWCYSRGYEREGDPEREYCGINAAFVLDELAALEQAEAAGDSPQAQALSDEARTIREALVATVRAGPLRNVWDRAILAEALFGLGRFGEAAPELAALRDDFQAGSERWAQETTAMQLAAIARLRDHDQVGGELERSKSALSALLGDEGHAVRRAYLGKVGLALSGGGFRASLFHIGVLARLAERGALHRVEVLSCVSGGSIVGAYYYLKLRRLLQAKPDDQIEPQDYVDLVRDLADEFLDAIRGDVRGQLTSNAIDNWKMFATSSYSRTDRIANLLDSFFYSTIPKDGGEPPGPWRMPDLIVNPVGRKGFSPRYENWRRRARVPILVVNATTLNTGHNWQYTASWMGEPPASTDEQVDANRRLRRVYYGDAPPGHQAPRLAQAVAASACVPGLFAPSRLEYLYPPAREAEGDAQEPRIELVDGGVHDNQGLASLLEQDCSVVLVSDATGQMGDRERPGRLIPSVLGRSNSILMSRVRGTQYLDLLSRRRGGSLRRVMIVHLKKGLTVRPRDWIGCPEPWGPEQDELTADHGLRRAAYAIDESVQRLLAELRTDLDRFSDDESLSLMAAGYRMADYELTEGVPDLPPLDNEPRPASPWPFEPALARLAQAAAESGLDLALGAGAARFLRGFKRWQLRRRKQEHGPVRRAVGRAAGVAGGSAATVTRAIVGVPVAAAGAGASLVTRLFRRSPS